ncbi:MAG: M48 family metallopeptidase [Capsulimonadales bacterium]|nr:M48 family metallopeptidase [Capsulimonadales bacterium]
MTDLTPNNPTAEAALTTGTTSRRTYPGIAPEAYRHPLDQQATAALKAVPGFEFAVSKLSRYSIEHIVYVELCASAVKVTPRQCSRVYALLKEACGILGVAEPALFLQQTPIANAFALGRERPLMMLQTGLVELLTEEELLGVIAHELGHIHCGHSVYRLMLLLIELATRAGGDFGGVGDVLSIAIQTALLEWQRKAEFSADRAAILVTQNPEAVFSSLFKLTGGSPKIFEQMDREEYLKQAEEYDRPDTSRLDRFYKAMLEAGKTHPIPVLRAREVLKYGDSDEYRAILSGRYAKYDKDGRLTAAWADIPVRCPNCQQEADPAFSFCTACGNDLAEERRRASEARDGKENP